MAPSIKPFAMLRRFSETFATPGLLLGLFVVMAALYGADRFLANLESREIAADARRLAATGESLLKRGRYREAVDAFSRAHVIERDNLGYQLALARALLMNGQPEQAIPALDDVLDENSNDGMANLLMARAMTQQHQNASADSFYHRAIYGSWPAGQQDQPVQARLELVRWLAQRGDEQSLLAELIPLEQRAQSDPAIAHALPALYLQAGSLTHAEEAYRAWIREHPNDFEAHAGLGRVEMQKGNFYAAQQSFAAALQLQPGNAALIQEADTARSAHELDPTSRHLASEEKLTRSNRILSMTIDAMQGCSSDFVAFDSAQKLIAEKVPRAPTNEMAETRLDLAERLWQGRRPFCNSAPDEARVLAVLIHKLEQ